MIRSYFQAIYDAVPFSIDAVRSRADWPAWRRPTLKALRTCLGLEVFPPRTPLRPRVVGSLQGDGYRMEKVVFQSRPGFLMTTNLYLPLDRPGPAPAILCVHGHGMEGKVLDEMQLPGINYARAGWVALAVDATGHGERVHIGHRRKFAIITSGLALEGIQVWDNMRAVDYLLSRPEVDAAHLGITGCSGGGNQTMYTAAVDERLSAAVPVCSVSTLRGQIFTPNSIGCDCECVPDLMRHGLENAVVCALIAPRPLLVLAGTGDVTFPIRYTGVAHRHLRRFYRAIGYAPRYRCIERPVTHGYHPPLRRLAQAWFGRWLGGSGFRTRYSERGLASEPAKRIWCFPGGQLPSGSATLGTLAHAAAKKLVARLAAARSEAARRALRRAIRQRVLGGFPPRGPLEARETRPLRRGGVVRWRVALSSEPGITIFARIARPVATGGSTRRAEADLPCPCVIRFRPGPQVPPWALAPALLARGVAVAELDLRPLDLDEHASKAALVLGRPMVGMGAYDITRFVDYLAGCEGLNGPRVWIWAEGLLTLPALYALALDERIARAALVGLLSTYVAPVPVPHPTWTFARGLLKYADIDHLVALAAPRPVAIANPVGPDLQPLSRADLERAFPAAREAFGAGGALRFLLGTEGDVMKATGYHRGGPSGRKKRSS